MLIAICDDSKADAEIIRFSLMDITDELETVWFSTGDELIKSIKNGSFYSLVFQDIYLEKEMGVDIAKTVKELSPDTQIIFVTTSLDHAIDAFKVQAADYLVKPCTEADVVKAFTRVTIRLSKQTSSSVVINAGKDIRVFYLENVIKLESDRHYTVIYCRNNRTERVLKNFSEAAELFGGSFIEIRRGILVNPDYIERISGATVILSDGSTYILPKAKKDIVVKQYTDYLTRQKAAK
ncbi:two component transcriptional regulator, LytTR family [Ruminococcaceae bacterium FB2012]|nr:two component transcriptional regulator, LytTR family [Ruminococcaceae bacterium FB2012]